MAFHCPNCGAAKWSGVCDACGFKEVSTKQLDAVSIIFCAGCGCHYSIGWCSVHPLEQQKVVLPIKKV